MARANAVTKRSRQRGTEVPLAQVMHVAEFRASLRSFIRHSESVAREWSLTPQRYLLLLMIKGAPDGSQRLRFTDLANRLQLTRNATTELVARAEDLGLIEREPATDDQRVTYLRVTKEGERRLEGALLEHEQLRRELVHAFDELTKTFRRATSSSSAERSTSKVRRGRA